MTLKERMMKQFQEGRSFDEIANWLISRMNLEVGKAYKMGKIEALMEEGYTPLEISEKLYIAESSVRNFVDKINKKNNKE